jgi:hypothetical protein
MYSSTAPNRTNDEKKYSITLIVIEPCLYYDRKGVEKIDRKCEESRKQMQKRLEELFRESGTCLGHISHRYDTIDPTIKVSESGR